MWYMKINLIGNFFRKLQYDKDKIEGNNKIKPCS